MRFRMLLLRAVRLRCPVCGVGKLFAGWFRMHSDCPHCETHFEREPGFFLGSIYFNYGLTAAVVAILYPILLFQRIYTSHQLMTAALVFVVLFPLWFFRYARSLWIGFDEYWDPRDSTAKGD